MHDVLAGFTTIWVVIGAGWLLAHLRVLDVSAQDALSRVSFHVGSPALLLTMMARADLARVFSQNVVATTLATCSAGLLYAVVSRVLVKPSRSEWILGTASACYVNSANLGIPVAAFVLHDVTWIAPLLLLQVGILQPVALALLDAEQLRASGQRVRPASYLTLPLRNPMTLGTLAGLVVNAAHLRLPSLLAAPLALLGDLSVPAMLLAFGISLRLGPLPGRGGVARATLLASTIKLLVHPAIAWLLSLALDLDAPTTLAVVVLAGLPTAQNVFVWSVEHGRGVVLVRDVIFCTTIASIVGIAGIAVLLP